MYKDFKDRQPDYQYTALLQLILNKGRKMETPFHGQWALQFLGARLEVDLAEGFPLITLRDVGPDFATALGEIIGFVNGARTQADLKTFGCGWWKRWVTADKCAVFGLLPGDLGPGSYGPVLKPQIEPLLAQMRDFPTARTHLLTTWDPKLAVGTKAKRRQVVVAPCHGTSVQFNLDPDARELEMVHVQRSGDVPVGVVYNMLHYTALGMMVGQVLGYQLRRLIYLIMDAHIYRDQVPFVEELLARAPRAFPTVTLDPSITDIFAFRPGHFTLSDYDPHPAMRIPTPT